MKYTDTDMFYWTPDLLHMIGKQTGTGIVNEYIFFKRFINF